MNTAQIRQSVKDKWLSYYAENREWLSRLGVWVNCDGQRRPASGFILATLSVLEPRLTQLLPLIVDLSSNPDRIVMALGLNFNPEDELTLSDTHIEAHTDAVAGDTQNGSVKLLPAAVHDVDFTATPAPTKVPAELDESCRGSRDRRD